MIPLFDESAYDPTPAVADGSFHRWLCETGYYKRPMVHVWELPDKSLRVSVGSERYCLDCPTRLPNWRHGETLRCKSCAAKKREKDNPRSKKKHICSDCGKDLVKWGDVRCVGCENERRKKSK